jgi:hypothetical protein
MDYVESTDFPAYPQAAEPTPPKKLRRMSRKKRGRYDRKLCFVYGLLDATGQIRYIGQTRTSLAKRLERHFADAPKGSSPVCKWLRQARDVQIFMIDSNATWDVSEILWIDRYRRGGHELLNVVRGGTDTVHAVMRETKTIIRAPSAPASPSPPSNPAAAASSS